MHNQSIVCATLYCLLKNKEERGVLGFEPQGLQKARL